MEQIQFFYKEQNAVPFNLPKSVFLLPNPLIEGSDLSELCTTIDQEVIEREWNVLKEKGCFSRPRGLTSLVDTSLAYCLVYQQTDYKTYAAASRTFEMKELSGKIYERMRVGCVGATVRMIDGSVLVHRRPYDASHVPGKYDSSVAGLCQVYDHDVHKFGTLDFVRDVDEKLSRELNIKDFQGIDCMSFNAIHSARTSDLSGMVDFGLTVNLEFGKMKERANQKYLQDLQAVPEQDLPEYIVKHFLEAQDLIADGCANLLSSLPPDVFLDTVKRINKKEKLISFGHLMNGIFIAQD